MADIRLIFFLAYILFLGIGFITFKIRAFIQLGFMVVFRKRHISVIFDDSRIMQFHAVKPDNKTFEVDESAYFLTPSKVWFMSIMEKLKIKKMVKVTTEEEKEKGIKEYLIKPECAYRFSNAPVSIYTKDNPEPLDIYNLKGDVKRTISGKYLSGLVKQIQIAGNLDILAKLDKYIPYAIGILLILALALAYLIVKGITPQIAAGAVGTAL